MFQPALLTRFVALAVGLGSLAVVAPARAQGTPTVKGASAAEKLPTRRRGYSLQQCVFLAERNYPKIAEARAKANYYRAQLDEARSAPFSRWSASAGVGLAPTSRGTSVYSPDTDVALSSNMGLAWRVNISGAIPLFTFGKISNLIDAAEHQVEVGEHEVNKERNQVRLDVRKAYFGLQLARSSKRLLRDAAGKLDKAIKKLARQVEDGEADEFDLFKLQTFRAEVDARMAEATRYASVAHVSLVFLTGVPNRFDVKSDQLKKTGHHLGPVATYLRAARIHRPEVNMARAGIR
ncbi:MAG: transporter, partial [Sorangium cellulosum]